MSAIGIDISKAKFDVCCLFNDKKRAKVFKNTASGFEEFLQWTGRLGLENPHFCMEATGCYGEALAEFLFEKKHKVSVINPLQIKHYKESRMIRQKTDKSDAFVIAQFCEQNNPILWSPKPLEIKRLSEVNQHISNLKDDFTMWNNRLEKEYVNDLVNGDILRKIKELKAEIKRFEKESKRIINSSPDLKEKFKKLTEIKGVGDKSAIAILTEMPSAPNFENAGQFAAFVGITPSHRQSGTSVNGKSFISKKGNPYIRKVLYMAAVSTKNHNEHFRKWVKKLEKKGKLPMVIVVAIMRKLLHIIFGMLKNGTSFDPNLAFNDGGSVKMWITQKVIHILTDHTEKSC